MIKKNKEYFDNLRKKTAQKYIMACFFGGFFGLPFYFMGRKKLFILFIVLLFVPGLNFFLMGAGFLIFALVGIGAIVTYIAGKFDYKIFKFIDKEEEENLKKESLELENFQKLSQKEQLKWNLDKGIITKEKYEKMIGLILINDFQEDLRLKLIKEEDLKGLIGEFQKEKIKDTDDFEEYEKSNTIEKLRILFLNNLIDIKELETLNK